VGLFQTDYFTENLAVYGIEPRTSGSVGRNPDHYIIEAVTTLFTLTIIIITQLLSFKVSVLGLQECIHIVSLYGFGTLLQVATGLAERSEQISSCARFEILMTIPITNTTTFSPHSSLSFLFFYFHFDTD
jgi:hypothetical protein